MKKLSLKWRIILPIALVLILGITTIIVVIARNYSNTATNLTQQNLEALSYRYANALKADLEMSFGSISALAASLESVAGTDRADREQVNQMIGTVLGANDRMFAIWSIFEPNAFDGRDDEYKNVAPYNDDTGRYVPYVYHLNGREGIEPSGGYDTPGQDNYYTRSRDLGRQNIITPYNYEVAGTSLLITTAAVPVKHGGKTVGVVAGDLMIEPIDAMVTSIKIFDSGYAFLLDQNGGIVAHHNKNTVLKPIFDYVDEDMSQLIRNAYRDGKATVYRSYSRLTGQDLMFAVCPFTLAATGES